MYITSQKYLDNLMAIHQHIIESESGKIENEDYIHVLQNAKKGDFVFLDPPYIEDYKYQLNYNINEQLNIDFIKVLLQTVSYLDKKNVKWLMTQADTPDVREVFRNYSITKFPVKRGYSNIKKYELIIKNY
jgi:DNA adenine methylase